MLLLNSFPIFKLHYHFRSSFLLFIFALPFLESSFQRFISIALSYYSNCSVISVVSLFRTNALADSLGLLWLDEGGSEFANATCIICTTSQIERSPCGLWIIRAHSQIIPHYAWWSPIEPLTVQTVTAVCSQARWCS